MNYDAVAYICLSEEKKHFIDKNIVDNDLKPNRMTWQWAETLVEIRVTLADIRGTTK